MNNRGFTLIELLVTLVLLTIVMSIGAYSIINIVNSFKQANYNSLIENIKSAVENYAMECKYAKNDSITCSTQITLGDLVKYGYLSGNGKDNEKHYTLVNPMDNNSIVGCIITYTYSGKKISVSPVSPSGSCPTSY